MKYIITGWGCDHAFAAAILMGAYDDCLLAVCSKENLAQALSSFTSLKRDDCDEVVILGLPLNYETQEIGNALSSIDRTNTPVSWISCYPLPERIPAWIRKMVRETVDNTMDLPHLAAKFISNGSGRIRNEILKLASADSKDSSRSKWTDLFEACAWKHRVLQSDHEMVSAIRKASALKYDENAKALAAQYRDFRKREFAGVSEAVSEIWHRIDLFAGHDEFPVLIGGETGTGKETVAMLIHMKSPERSGGPFVPFNCADLNEQLLASRLFGHEKGAFTGAAENRSGAVEQAAGGTLFLDEIGELPPASQALLLRVLQEKKFTRLGGKENACEADVRIIAATHRNLPDMIREGTFREDLYYRLCAMEIRIPPLRERKEDLIFIADKLLKSRGLPTLSKEEKETLTAYGWPGNVRELSNVISRVLVYGTRDFGKLIGSSISPVTATDGPLPDRLEDAIKVHARAVFRKYGENKAKTTKALGISFNTLQKHLGVS